MNSLSYHGGGVPVKRPRFIGIARDILETIGDGFCAIDREWKLVYVNQPTCEMWGLRSERLIGRNFWDVFPQMTAPTRIHSQRAKISDKVLYSTQVPASTAIRRYFSASGAQCQEH
jgi:PAS domain-containing protein